MEFVEVDGLLGFSFFSKNMGFEKIAGNVPPQFRLHESFCGGNQRISAILAAFPAIAVGPDFFTA